jgi:hypothetical protein
MLAVIALAAYVLTRPPSSKHGFVVNQEVFNNFQGKLQLENELAQVRAIHKKALDSVSASTDLRSEIALHEYQKLEHQYLGQEKDLSERYTADIWRAINKSIDAFARDNGYDFIYGATGNGSLMSGNASFNITKEVTDYCNKQYEEGK